MNKRKILSIIAILLLITSAVIPRAYAGELEEIEKELAELNKRLEMSRQATAPLETTLNQLEKDLTNLQARIGKLEVQVAQKEKQVLKNEADLQEQQSLLELRIREFYKKSTQLAGSGLQLLLASSDDAAKILRLATYNQTVLTKDRDEIIQLVLFIKNLEEKKKELEDEKVRLAAVKAETDKQAAFLRREVKGAKEYQAQLSGKIAKLTARQQSILAQRLGSLNLPTSLGAGKLYCTDDRDEKYNPNFRPAFAFFTYGIPHRVGMNQYGAYGRASAEQPYDQILRTYYNFNGYQDGVNATIKVNNGNGVNQGSIIWTGSLDDYVRRIYEMPSSWPLEALKAQAIAARSYALAVTDNGNNSICANQYCQVFKTDPKGGDWETAVSQTPGRIMVSDGQPITAWYSSTDGGYTFQNDDVWGGNHRSWTKRTQDTNGGVGSFSDLNNNAYDKDSPCFYAAQGWRDEYNKSAWLKSDELADIVNALMLAKQDGSIGEHLYQTDKPHPFGGEVWNEERVKSELKSRGITPYESVTDVSVGADFGSGRTTSVTVSGNAGTQTFSGDEFKDYFNLRAPANIQIVGPLFNIEKK